MTATVKKLETSRMNAKEARARLLSGSSILINDMLVLATGSPNPEVENGPRINVDPKARVAVFDAIIPMIQQAGDIQKVEAESTQDVIGLIKDGLVTFTEARDLMQMLSTKSDIEDMKVLLEKMGALSAD